MSDTVPLTSPLTYIHMLSLLQVFVEHGSVEEMRRKHVEPIALSDCLEAFCSEETLEYSCDKCRKVQQAAKKLQIWRLPPILVSIDNFCK